MWLTCKHCKHEWNYKGNNKYRAVCPKCYQAVRIKYRKGYEIPLIKEMDLRYIAGFFDGEGSVYISESINRGKSRLSMGISIGNTNQEVLEYIADIFQTGKVHLDKITKGNKNFYVWRRSGFIAAEILKSIVPYMMVRKKQAELGICFQTSISNDWGYNRWNPVPHEILEKRKEIRIEMKELNK